MIKTKSKNQFPLKDLLTKYGSQPVISSAGKDYTYWQLFKLVQRATKRFDNNSEKIIKLTENDPLKFITDFLAIVQTENYPLIGSFITDQFDLKIKDLTTETFFFGLTYGTTGEPKVYRRNWLSWKKGFDCCRKLFNLDAVQSIATSSPLTTSLGLHTLMLAIYLGKKFYLIDNIHQLNSLSGDACLFSVPTFLLQSSNNHNIPPNNLRTIFLGGGTLTSQGIKKIKQQFSQAKLFEFYGSSETSFISWQDITNGKFKFSAGQLFPNTQVSIGLQQEIIVTSPYLFSGYLAQTPPKNWVTDDLGFLKKNHLFLLGRKADLIDHGGNKVAPLEIETAASDLCQKCVAFGVEDQVYGQKIALLMIKPITKKQLQKKLAQRLEKFKCPNIYLVTNEIPLTSNLKISRSQLAQAYRNGEYDEI